MRKLSVTLIVMAGTGTATADRLPVFPYEQLPVRIESASSGKCLDIRAAGGDGAVLQQYTCGEQENQTFHLLFTGGDRYQVRPGHHGNVRLAVPNTGNMSPASLVNYETPAELFRFTPNADGTFSIVNNQSGRCLDVPWASPDDGVGIVQYDCHGGANQRWRITPRPRPLHLRVKHTGKCLDVTGANTQPYATMQQYDCLGSQQDNQDWIIERSGGDWQLRAQHSNMCLSANGYGTGLIQYPCGGYPFQVFTFEGTQDGYSQIRNRALNTCVQVTGAQTGNQSPLNLGPCTGGDHQKFEPIRNVRRRLLVIQPATSTGQGRYTANASDIEHQVADANGMYRSHGVELLFDPATDYLNVDSDALYRAGEADADTVKQCAPFRGWQIWQNATGCGEHYRSLYPDRVIIVVGPGSFAGFSSGEMPYIFLRPGLAWNQCNTGVAGGQLPHELGHYLGLGHTMHVYPTSLAAGDAYLAANQSIAAFEADLLDDTPPDAHINGTSCLDPAEPYAYQWISVKQGTLPTRIVGIPVMTSNIMSYYFSLDPQITLQQAAIVRATATIRTF